MLVFFLTLGVLASFVVLMSLGLLIKGKELKGTCASQSAAFNEGGTCGVCGQNPGSCQTEDKTSVSLSN